MAIVRNLKKHRAIVDVKPKQDPGVSVTRPQLMTAPRLEVSEDFVGGCLKSNLERHTYRASKFATKLLDQPPFFCQDCRGAGSYLIVVQRHSAIARAKGVHAKQQKQLTGCRRRR